MSGRKLVASVTGEAAPPRGIGDHASSWTERVAAVDEWEHRHESEWARIDQKLRGIAARRAALDAEEANLLRYAEELKLWRGWGYGSMLEYMERVMGYAPHTAAERLRVARALAELPLLAEALERGQLAHSAVRELSRVVVPETEADWLEAVQGKCLREVEAMVSRHKPGDLPTDETEPRLRRRTVTLELSPETYDIWRKLHALAAEEHGQRLSDDELIPALFRRAYSDGTAGGRAGALAGTLAPATAGTAAATAGTAGTAAATASIAAATAGTATAGTAAATAGTAAATAGTAAATAGTAAATAGTAAATSIASSAASTAAAPSGTTCIAIAPGTSSTAAEPAASGSPGSPAYKIALKQCPDCKRAWQYTGGRDIEVDPAVLELAACDAVHLGSLDAAAPERATTTVTPRKREQVLARDGYCCTVPGCRRSVGLDLHHIEYQSRGGGHELRNLTTTCDLHHRAVHFEKLVIRGAAPDRLTFEFRKPRDRRNVTDDDPRPGSTAALSEASPPKPAASAISAPASSTAHAALTPSTAHIAPTSSTAHAALRPTGAD